MPQIFRPYADTVARAALVAIPTVPLLGIGIAYWFATSNHITGQSIVVDQPIPFSHQHHIGGLGIDCRYCHAGVEVSATGGIPPTHTCHSQLYTNAQMLAPLRTSLAEQRPIHWSKVNRLPDYVYFDHSIHIAKGVSCTTCHGPVDRMPLMQQAVPLTMEWCLDCYRDPAPNLRPASQVFDAAWKAPADQAAQRHALLA